MGDTRRQSRKGVNFVCTLVEGPWNCGWQEYAPQNDNAVDGMIIMRRGSQQPRDTGGIVFVQIKCGSSYLAETASYPNHHCIKLGADYLSRHTKRWNRLPGPVVMVYVTDTTPPLAWWVDVKQDCLSPTNKGAVLIPKNQRFAEHTKGTFHKLCGWGCSDRELPLVALSNNDLVPFKLSTTDSLKRVAWNYYKAWREESHDHVHPHLGRVLINRVGWKHITRQGRNQHRVIYSWQLLCAAKAMIRLGFPTAYLGNANVIRNGEVTTVVDYVGIRANVTFPHRDSCVVQVVLKRARTFVPTDNLIKQKIWFLSVYEKRRGEKGNLP